MPEVDYDRIARQHGGKVVTEPDYDAIARQHGGSVVQEQPQGLYAALQGATGISETPWYSRPIIGDVSPASALGALPAIGGAIGGILGAPSGPGAVAGAAIGGAGGEAARQLAARGMGIPQPQPGPGLLGAFEPAEKIGTQGAIQAGAELGGRAVIGGLGKAVKTLLPAPEKQYAQALGATTVANKQVSAKIVPELLKRRITGSREGIKELAEKQIGEVGAQLDAAIAKVPKGTAADTVAVMDQLHKLKRQYVVPSGTPGVNTIVDKGAYDNLSKLQNLVASTQPTFESLRRLRQILDGVVTAGDKTFGRTIAEGSELDATREAANAIRRELAKASPDVARINKEFSFWKNVDRVVGATIQRTASQSKGLGQQIAEGFATPAAIAGVATGQAPAGVGIGVAVALRKLVQSPAWKTYSAVQKERLAEAIARGGPQQSAAYFAHALTGVAGVRSEQDGQAQ